MEELDAVVKRLCRDKYFGIYTRNYVEYMVEQNFNDIPYTTIIIDFNGVKQMNSMFGYEKVNNIFKDMFLSFQLQKDIIIGRWFSGDEIVIVTIEDPLNVINDLNTHCKKFSLTFKIILITNKKIYDIKIF